AVESLFKHHKGRKHSGRAYTSINDHSTGFSAPSAGNVNSPDTPSTSTTSGRLSVPGLRSTGWASEASDHRRSQIAGVLQACSTKSATNTDPALVDLDSQNKAALAVVKYAGLANARVKRQLKFEKRRRVKTDKLRCVGKPNGSWKPFKRK
ncbi:unnamed protein product, partial [Protopolystoma xenopodis]